MEHSNDLWPARRYPNTPFTLSNQHSHSSLAVNRSAIVHALPMSDCKSFAFCIRGKREKHVGFHKICTKKFHLAMHSPNWHWMDDLLHALTLVYYWSVCAFSVLQLIWIVNTRYCNLSACPTICCACAVVTHSLINVEKFAREHSKVEETDN